MLIKVVIFFKSGLFILSNFISLVPLDQDDKQFSLKLIEDLNKVWESLSSKKKYFQKKFLKTLIV